jgi:4-aminobutyrate aminotransferase
MPSWLSLFYDEPLEIVSGSGRRVVGGDGREYLDFFAGILTNAIGYDIPEVSDAIRRQVDTGVLHTSTLYLIRQQVELAERIAKLSGIPDAKVFFTNSGTEANLNDPGHIAACVEDLREVIEPPPPTTWPA